MKGFYIFEFKKKAIADHFSYLPLREVLANIWSLSCRFHRNCKADTSNVARQAQKWASKLKDFITRIQM